MCLCVELDLLPEECNAYKPAPAQQIATESLPVLIVKEVRNIYADFPIVRNEIISNKIYNRIRLHISLEGADTPAEIVHPTERKGSIPTVLSISDAKAEFVFR